MQYVKPAHTHTDRNVHTLYEDNTQASLLCCWEQFLLQGEGTGAAQHKTNTPTSNIQTQRGERNNVKSRKQKKSQLLFCSTWAPIMPKLNSPCMSLSLKTTKNLLYKKKAEWEKKEEE